MMKAVPKRMSFVDEGLRKDAHASQSSAAPPSNSSAQQTVSSGHTGIGLRQLTIVIVKVATRRRENRIVERVDPASYGCHESIF